MIAVFSDLNTEKQSQHWLLYGYCVWNKLRFYAEISISDEFIEHELSEKVQHTNVRDRGRLYSSSFFFFFFFLFQFFFPFNCMYMHIQPASNAHVYLFPYFELTFTCISGFVDITVNAECEIKYSKSRRMFVCIQFACDFSVAIVISIWIYLLSSLEQFYCRIDECYLCLQRIYYFSSDSSERYIGNNTNMNLQ